MGNDSSRLNGLVIEKNAVDANDFWALYNAESFTTSNEEGRQLLSIFQGEPVVSGQLWVSQGPMERAIKNLMIYRHPYILKYVTTWDRGGQKHLATERVRPLNSVLSTQSDLQVCLGLRTILCSLIFLIEKAMARHLNICSASIYITDVGSWRLAGFEYVWKCKEVTKTLLDLASAYRYKPTIDPGELLNKTSDCIEQYAFATLCEEILTKCTKSDTAIPHVQEFREYCATHLKHKNPQMRPKLSAVLLHPYFNHEFVLIHSFRFELPLKSLQEKQDFFTGLIDRLRYFNEDVVAAQLAADLLSRMVLLDPTAQLCVTPYVLKTKSDHAAALFSNHTYIKHLMPHIKRMFRLRDAQIRLILLEYFMDFVRLLPEEDVKEFILPHLHAGMNDTNDVLVAKTLRCLGDLVPILGAAAVVGGNRTRIFSDGRPQAAKHDATTHWVEPRSITPVLGNNVDYMVSDSPLPDVDLSGSFNSLPQAVANEQLEMPTRLSPDGGEDDKSAHIITDNLINIILENSVSPMPENAVATIVQTVNESAAALEAELLLEAEIEIDAEDEEQWSDWETDELQRLNGDAQHDADYTTADNISHILPSPSSTTTTADNSTLNLLPTLASQVSLSDSYRTTQSNASSMHSLKPTKINDDLNALDIQVQISSTPMTPQSTEFDFFKDMEPVIEIKPKSSVKLIPTQSMLSGEDEIIIDSSRFAAITQDNSNIDAADGLSVDAGDGWGVDDDEAVV